MIDSVMGHFPLFLLRILGFGRPSFALRATAGRQVSGVRKDAVTTKNNPETK